MSGEIYLDGTVTPTSAAPIANDTDIFGGFRVVLDASERNAIPTSRRKKGMRVYEQSSGVLWYLWGDPPWTGLDEDWAVLSGQSEYLAFQPMSDFPLPGPYQFTMPPYSTDLALDMSNFAIVGVAIELPNVSNGTRYSVKDSTHYATAKPIVITPALALPAITLIEQWDGTFSTNLVIDKNGTSVTLRRDFFGWVIL